MKLAKFVFLTFCATSFFLFSGDDATRGDEIGARQLVSNTDRGRRASWSHLIHVAGPLEPMTTSLLFVSESEQASIFAIKLPGSSDASSFFVTIPPHGSLCENIWDLVRLDSWPSYLTIRQIAGDKLTTVRVVYENTSKEGNQAIVKPAFNRGTNWLLFPSNWRQVTDRLVIFNPNKSAASVFIRQVDGDGYLVVKRLVASLPGLGKQEIVVGSPESSLFESIPGCSYQVVSDVAITLTGLSFPSCNNSILWELPVQVN